MLSIALTELNSSVGYTDDSAKEFASTTSSCKATGYPITTPSSYALNDTRTMTALPSATRPPLCITECKVKAGDTCNSIAHSQNVSTFGITYKNQLDAYCSLLPPEGTSLCLPESCEVYKVQPGDNCIDFVWRQSKDLTVSQLQSWNPNISSLCGNLERLSDTIICVSLQGGYFATEPNVEKNTSVRETAVSALTNVESGTTTRCGKYYTVRDKDTCARIIVRFGVSVDEFQSLDPVLNPDCTNLTPGSAYCVQAISDIKIAANFDADAHEHSCKGHSTPSLCFGDASELPDAPLIAGNASLTWVFRRLSYHAHFLNN